MIRELPEEENYRGKTSAKALFRIWVETIADPSKDAEKEILKMKKNFHRDHYVIE